MEEKETEVNVFDFDDYNKVFVGDAASQKATRSDNTGIQVHWSVWDNLKGFLQQNYGPSLENPVEKFKLKRLLMAWSKLALRIWKSYLKQDVVSFFEKEGKEHTEGLDWYYRGKSGGLSFEGVLVRMGPRFFNVVLSMASGLSRFCSVGCDSDGPLYTPIE